MSCVVTDVRFMGFQYTSTGAGLGDTWKTQRAPVLADQLLHRTGCSSQSRRARCGLLGIDANLTADSLNALSSVWQRPIRRVQLARAPDGSMGRSALHLTHARLVLTRHQDQPL